MLGYVIYQDSIDGGERWMLNNAFGKPIYGWDSMSQITHSEYDELHRPTKSYIDDGSTNRLIADVTYGEGQTNDKNLNLRGQVYKTKDTAGENIIVKYDFKGQPLESTLELIEDEEETDIDWDNTPTMSGEVFTTTIIYDALSRLVQKTDAGENITKNTYNEAGLLEKVEMKPNGNDSFITYVDDINYNAKGQREAIYYGNDTKTKYEYDEKTYQVKRILTTKNSGADIVQDLQYVYDAVGNITYTQNAALEDVFFNNQQVAPEQYFTYDALYRLIEATGRETFNGQDDDSGNGPGMYFIKLC